MADMIRYGEGSARVYWSVREDDHASQLIPVYITTGTSCLGYVGDDGMMHETVRDADGVIVRERHTPFREWNRI